MTGRARGRSRGRARAAQAEPAPVPGAPSSLEEAPQVPAQKVARGRGRAPTQAPPAATPQPSELKRLGEQVAEMKMSGGASAEERPYRGGDDGGLVTRPSNISETTGSFGRPISLKTNFFVLGTGSKFTGFFQYMVSYNPPIESRNLKFMLLKDHSELLGTVRAFDGMILYLPKKLPDLETKLMSTRRSDGSSVEITIKFTNEFPFSSPRTIQLLNIIFRRILKIMEMQQIGRSFFSPKRNIDLDQHRLQLWPGYNTSILRFDAGVLLNIDVSHKVMRLDTVLDILTQLYSEVGENRFHNIATKKLVGETVLTRYNNKTYKIDDIAWDKNLSHSFAKRDGSKITMRQYYKEAYDKDLTNDQQPLLVSNPKKRDIRRGQTEPILLVPELCYITGLSDDIRQNFQIMKELAVHTRMGPEPRAKQLKAFMDELNRNAEASKQLTDWNLGFGNDLHSIKARNIPPETIAQKSKQFSYKAEDADWSRDMRGANLISTINLNKWMILFSSRDKGIAQDFYQTLQKVNPPMGIEVNKPEMIMLKDDRADSYITAIREQKQPDTQLVLCIVPNNRKDRYDAIKKYCCVDYAVPSQVVVSRTLSKKQMLMSVSTKIGIQLNCKLGGEVWAVDVPVKNMMVVGIDVYHDSLTKGKSIGGFVASTNQSLTRYYSRITQQQTGLEFVDGLKTCMTAALRKFNEINKVLPDRIIVYRDGVGDGQIPMVYEHEMPQIREAIAQINPGYNPKFAWVIVSKRINAKFFLEAGRNLANPPPGTVVDVDVTRSSEKYDFFLVSQSVRQGTVSPTHYNIIYDTSGLKPDHIQRLTYKLTHLYYNWQGTIRVPAPCQYAHKLAFLVGQSVHKEPDLALADRLYYL